MCHTLFYFFVKIFLMLSPSLASDAAKKINFLMSSNWRQVVSYFTHGFLNLWNKNGGLAFKPYDELSVPSCVDLGVSDPSKGHGDSRWQSLRMNLFKWKQLRTNSMWCCLFSNICKVRSQSQDRRLITHSLFSRCGTAITIESRQEPAKISQRVEQSCGLSFPTLPDSTSIPLLP